MVSVKDRLWIFYIIDKINEKIHRVDSLTKLEKLIFFCSKRLSGKSETLQTMDLEKRREAANQIGLNFSILSNKESAYEDLHQLLKDKSRYVRQSAAKSMSAAFPLIPDKIKAWNDLIHYIYNESLSKQKGIAEFIGVTFTHIPDKKQAWDDLHQLTLDKNGYVRWEVAFSMQAIFPYIPDKEQAQDDLHRLTLDMDSYVRRGAAIALGTAFPYIPHKKQAWDDLHRLLLDKQSGVRRHAVYSLITAFPHIPDKRQAWDDLIKLLQDKTNAVRWLTAFVIGSVFPFVLDKKKAEDDLHRLSLDNDRYTRLHLASALGFAFEHIVDKRQAYADLHRLTLDTDSSIRWQAAYAMSTNINQFSEKNQVQYDLHRLIKDKDSFVRRRIGYALYIVFSHMPDKNQAWGDLVRLIHDVQQVAEYILVEVFDHVTDKNQAWKDLLQLIHDKDLNYAGYTLGAVFICMPDKKKAQYDLHKLTQDNDRNVRYESTKALGIAFSHMPDKNLALEDLHRLKYDKDESVRQLAEFFQVYKEKTSAIWRRDFHPLTPYDRALTSYDRDLYMWKGTICSLYSQVHLKNRSWKDLIWLAQDKKNVLQWRMAYTLRVAHLQESVNQEEIRRKTMSSELEDRREALYILSNCFEFLVDKKQALEDIRQLMHDECIGIRASAIDTLGIVSHHIHEKKQIWEDLIQIMKEKEIILRHLAIGAMINIFYHISNLKQSWGDMQNLTSDHDDYIRQCAAKALSSTFSRIFHENRWWALEIIISGFIPDEEKVYEEIIWMTQDKSSSERLHAAYALFTIIPHVSNKDKLWKDIIRLTQDEDSIVQRHAASALVSVFPYIFDKEQAWYDLQRLMQGRDSEVRSHVASALGSIFPHVHDKKQLWDSLIHLSQDKNCNVRVSANYSLGRASLLKAVEAKNEQDFKKELENALTFFEKSSIESPYFNPASFCLPFYRSFYILTFEKQEVESEIQKYLDDARKAVRGSESKEKLFQAIENIANALREVQKVWHFDEMKCDLKVYARYLEYAANLLAITQEKAPGATELIKKGLPIIDEKIKRIIAEIQNKAKVVCDETRDTPLEKIALKTCKQAQDLSSQNPLVLGLGLSRMIENCKRLCEYIKQKDKRRFVYEKLNNLGTMEISVQPYIFAEVFNFISNNLDIPQIQNLYISEIKKEVVRVAVAQFVYELTKSFPPIIKNKEAVKTKIFSSLDIAKKEGTDIVCLPELCLCEEWIPEIKNKYHDIIIIGGGFYKDGKNVCPVITKSDIDIPPQSKLTPSAIENPEMWERGMIRGDRIYKYETKFGKFVILICRDFENLVHYFRDIDIDFIFCPAFNPANERFHQEANSHVTKTPSYILIANTGIYGGTSIFAQLNKNYFDRLVGDGCKDDGDLSYKLCEVKKDKEEVIIADFDLTCKTIQIPTPSDSFKEKRSVTHIKRLPIT